MPSRFELAPEWVAKMVDEVRGNYFPGLDRFRIMALWDTKRREKGGQLILARIKKAGDVERLLAEGSIVPAEDIHGLAYVMFVDQAIFEAIEKPDQVRIIRHELRHIWVEWTETGKVQFKIWDHDIQDFKSEVTLNEDDPEWRERVRLVANSVYDESGKPIPKPDPNQGDLFDKPEAEPEPDSSKEPDSKTRVDRLQQMIILAVNEGKMVDGYPDPEFIRSAFGLPSEHTEPTDEEIRAMFDKVKAELELAA